MTWTLARRLVVVTTTSESAQSVTRFVYDGDGARVLEATEAGTTIYIGEYTERN